MSWLWPWPKARKITDHALYEERRDGRTAKCSFFTPTRGSREHIVLLTVDEIEDLILEVDRLRREKSCQHCKWPESRGHHQDCPYLASGA